MPIHNFLELYVEAPLDPQSRPIRVGDAVFHITMETPGNGGWTQRPYAHTGLVATPVETYRLGDEVTVYHMGKRIERNAWSNPDGRSRVDVVGTISELDDSVRSRLIDAAFTYYHKRPRILRDQQSLYWMGDPQPNCHPRYPDEDSAYGFSCATFLHQCFVDIDHPLVAVNEIPLTTARELDELGQALPESSQRTPFRRLYPGYLIGAFCTDSYPFRPDDWEAWKDLGRFIPPADTGQGDGGPIDPAA